MSGSNELYRRLRDPNSVVIDGSGPLGGWEDAYMIDGAVRECHTDFRATPIGNNPNGFLICQRKKDYTKHQPPVSAYPTTSQSYNLYDDKPDALPRYTYLGGQPNALPDRRYPNQAHLQGADYYKDCIQFRAIGLEKVDKTPGDFGYRENKYYYSAPPPLYDITQAVQPYAMWRREQIRMGTFTEDQMKEFEKTHNYVEYASTF
jgi:hypothetical protein